ncbi:MAG: hypothetical protein ABH951_00320 [Patescibacteria group bacterium]
MKTKVFFIVAKVSVILIALFTTIFRVTEIVLFKGTEGYSLATNVSGMLVLLALLIVFYFALQIRRKWGFWYSIFMSFFLLFAYLFKTPFNWFYAGVVVLSVVLIVSLFIIKKDFKKIVK